MDSNSGSVVTPKVFFKRCDFKNNTAENDSAIYHSNQTELTLEQTAIVNNNSMVRCTIESNNSSSMDIRNSIVANNSSAKANAIGVITTTRNQNIFMLNNTILGETKDRYLITLQIGEGKQVDATIANTIIAHQNPSFSKSLIDFNNGILNLNTSHCYIQGNSVIGASDSNFYEDIDGPLILNSDYSLDECSLGVNDGDNSFYSHFFDPDFANRSRFRDSIVDIGAYEAQDTCSVFPRIGFEKPKTVLNVFPNPTFGEVAIDLDSFKEGEVLMQIHDAVGRLIKEDIHQIEKRRNTLDFNIENQVSGMYYLSIFTNEETITRKIIKK